MSAVLETQAPNAANQAAASKPTLPFIVKAAFVSAGKKPKVLHRFNGVAPGVFFHDPAETDPVLEMDDVADFDPYKDTVLLAVPMLPFDYGGNRTEVFTKEFKDTISAMLDRIFVQMLRADRNLCRELGGHKRNLVIESITPYGLKFLNLTKPGTEVDGYMKRLANCVYWYEHDEQQAFYKNCGETGLAKVDEHGHLLPI